MCDTLVALGNATSDGSVIFAKNSDRSANECQPLNYYPRRTYPGDAVARCTWIDVPQVSETFAVLGSRPYWMWGFEIGINEHGVAIGNEAVYSREPYQQTGLLGMDLIRLGLERGRTAYESMHVIIGLLERYGQGGCCDIANPRTYHNSFILADPTSAWVLETAGRRWVAERVHGRRSISNVLTIHQEWDEASPDLIDHAVAEGWSQPGEEFDFARAYGDPNRDVHSGACRFMRSSELLAGRSGLAVSDLFAVLRDHERVLDDVRIPPICMHATPPRLGETAASLVAHLRPNAPALLRACAWTSFGSPCLGIPLPLHVGAVVPPVVLGAGGSTFDQASPWWRTERIQRRVDLYPSLKSRVDDVCRNARQAIETSTARIEEQARRALDSDARRLLQSLADESTKRLFATLDTLDAVTADVPSRSPGSSSDVRHWNGLSEPVGIALT